MIDLLMLRDAGADVAGDNGTRWLRLSAVRKCRLTILDRIRELHLQLGRRVLPEDVAPGKPGRPAKGAP